MPLHLAFSALIFVGALILFMLITGIASLGAARLRTLPTQGLPSSVKQPLASIYGDLGNVT